jgi:hypothetical protein
MGILHDSTQETNVLSKALQALESTSLLFRKEVPMLPEPRLLSWSP